METAFLSAGVISSIRDRDSSPVLGSLFSTISGLVRDRFCYPASRNGSPSASEGVRSAHRGPFTLKHGSTHDLQGPCANMGNGHDKDTNCSRTPDSDIAISSSLGPDINIALDGSAGRKLEHGPSSSVVPRLHIAPG